MVALRGGAVLPLAMCVGIALAGCAGSTTKGVPTAAPHPPSAAAVRKVDVLRLADIKDEFPSGTVVNPLYGPRKLDAGQAESAGDLVSYGEALTVSPDPCGALLKPVVARAGTETVSVTSATGPQDPFIAVSVYDPVSVPVAIPESGCDRFTFVVETASPDGRAEQLAAPQFDDAVTCALKVVFVVDSSSVEVPLVEYFYSAILDGRTFVNLWARVPSDFSAEPALPGLLTKAVNAIRDR